MHTVRSDGPDGGATSPLRAEEPVAVIECDSSPRGPRLVQRLFVAGDVGAATVHFACYATGTDPGPAMGFAYLAMAGLHYAELLTH